MPRKLSNALTPLAVKNAKPGRHADGGGLHLLVKETGARSWVYRFMLKGKSRDIGLGAAGQGGISLADARTARDALRLKVKAGIDPLEERQREATEALAAAQAAAIAGMTFKAVAEAYIGANEASWRNNKHRQQWRNTLASYVYPVMGELPVADLVPVVMALQRGWLRRITGQPYRARVIHSKPIGGRLGLEAGNPDLHAVNLEAALAYVLKGATREAASQFGLERLEPGGRVIGKRCGTSQNIGAKARNAKD